VRKRKNMVCVVGTVDDVVYGLGNGRWQIVGVGVGGKRGNICDCF